MNDTPILMNFNFNEFKINRFHFACILTFSSQLYFAKRTFLSRTHFAFDFLLLLLVIRCFCEWHSMINMCVWLCYWNKLILMGQRRNLEEVSWRWTQHTFWHISFFFKYINHYNFIFGSEKTSGRQHNVFSWPLKWWSNKILLNSIFFFHRFFCILISITSHVISRNDTVTAMSSSLAVLFLLFRLFLFLQRMSRKFCE